MRLPLILLYLLFMLLPAGSPAQALYPAFKRYMINEGRGNADVYQMIQDSKGYIWLATSNGVCRFNGYEFEIFTMREGLPDNTVFNMAEDSKGRVWFLPLNNKLSYYENGKIHLYPHNDVVARVAGTSLKSAFFIDKADNIYLSVYRNGWCRIGADGKLSPFPVRQCDSAITYISEPVEGRFLLTCNLKKNTREDRELHLRLDTRHEKLNLSLPIALSGRGYYGHAIRLKSQTLVLAFDNTLIFISPDGHYRTKTFPAQLTTFYKDRHDVLWIGTYRDGVYIVRNEDFDHAEHIFGSHSINGILVDQEGGSWLTGETNAIYYAPSAHMHALTTEEGLHSNTISCLSVIDSNLLAGTNNGFIERISRTKLSGSIDLNALLDRNTGVQALFNDRAEGKARVSVYKSSLYLDAGSTPLRASKERCSFRQGLNDLQQNTWLACSFGLVRRDGKDNYRGIDTTMAQKLNVYSMLMRDSHNLYLGTINGLWNFRIPDSSLSYTGMKHPLLRHRVAHMAYLPDSTVAIATNGAGLLLYGHGQLQQIDATMGLADNNAFRLLVRRNAIWVGTAGGLSRVSLTPGTPRAYTIENYTIEDGLASNQVSDMVEYNGFMWLATDNGLSFFRADSLKKNRQEIPLYIEHLSINDRDTALLSEYILPYNANSFKLRYIALSYKKMGRLHYRYKMEGLDTNWVYTDARETQYTTLPGGSYRFMLAVRLSNGEWSRALTLRFRIGLPFWKTWWFWTVAGVAVSGVVVGAVVGSRFAPKSCGGGNFCFGITY